MNKANNLKRQQIWKDVYCWEVVSEVLMCGGTLQTVRAIALGETEEEAKRLVRAWLQDPLSDVSLYFSITSILSQEVTCRTLVYPRRTNENTTL